MLTSKVIVALIMLFALSPVAKLTRRLVYALMEQFDRGNPADEATSNAASGALKTAGAIAGAGVAIGAGAVGLKSVFGKGKGGDGGGKSAPFDGKPSEESVETGGSLPEKQPDIQESKGTTGQNGQGRQGSGIVNHKGQPISSSSSGRSRQAGSGDNPQAGNSGSSETVSGGSSQTGGAFGVIPEKQEGLNTVKPDTIDKAGKWANVGGKAGAVAGGALATAGGMVAGTVFGRGAGRAITHHGTKLAHRAGQAIGGAGGMAVHGGKRAGQHLKQGYHKSRDQGKGRMSSFANGVKTVGNQGVGSIKQHVKDTKINRSGSHGGNLSGNSHKGGQSSGNFSGGALGGVTDGGSTGNVGGYRTNKHDKENRRASKMQFFTPDTPKSNHVPADDE